MHILIRLLNISDNNVSWFFDKDDDVSADSADPKFSIGSNWKNRFYPMNEPDDILLCDKVKGNWTDEKIATEIPAWVQKGYFQISDIKFHE